MSINNKDENNQLVKQNEIEKEIAKFHPKINQLIENNQVKKVYEGESKGADVYTDENGDISKINLWEKKYRGVEFHKNQQKTQEISSIEKKTPQQLVEQSKPVELENPIKANQGAEISQQKSEKVVEIPVNPGTISNNNTNSNGSTSGSEN